MRKLLFDYINKNNIKLFHCDMFPYKSENTIDLMLQEQNMVNVAAGYASTGRVTFMYSVCGFIVLRALEQLKFSVKEFASKKSCIILFVAGGSNFDCYKDLGIGHQFYEDTKLYEAMGFKYFTPKYNEFKDLLDKLIKTKCFYIIRLGKDQK